MSKKTKLLLLDKNEEIYNELPKEYRDIIFNNFLSKIMMNNKFYEETSLYLDDSEVEKVMLTLNIPLKKKRIIPKKTYLKNKKNTNNIPAEIYELFTF